LPKWFEEVYQILTGSNKFKQGYYIANFVRGDLKPWHATEDRNRSPVPASVIIPDVGVGHVVVEVQGLTAGVPGSVEHPSEVAVL
jgi:hypothetical protein